MTKLKKKLGVVGVNVWLDIFNKVLHDKEIPDDSGGAVVTTVDKKVTKEIVTIEE